MGGGVGGGKVGGGLCTVSIGSWGGFLFSVYLLIQSSALRVCQGLILYCVSLFWHGTNITVTNISETDSSMLTFFTYFSFASLFLAWSYFEQIFGFNYLYQIETSAVMSNLISWVTDVVARDSIIYKQCIILWFNWSNSTYN